MNCVWHFTVSAFVLGLWLTVDARAPNPALFTGQTCNMTSDCNTTNDPFEVDGTFCNEQNKCECQLGWAPETIANQTLCNYKECHSNAECAALYGPKTQCKYVTSICGCETSFEYNLTEHECQPGVNISKLGEACGPESHCAELASCADGVCRCLVGNKAVNEYACDLFQCQNDAECSQVTPNSVCRRHEWETEGFGLCDCRRGTFTDDAYTECVLPKAKRGEPCKAGDCGPGAACLKGQCKCPHLHTPAMDNEYSCEAVSCIKDEDCGKLDVNSVCDIIQCKCKNGMAVDVEKQICTSATTTTVQPIN